MSNFCMVLMPLFCCDWGAQVAQP